jgi:hypothetical protein
VKGIVVVQVSFEGPPEKETLTKDGVPVESRGSSNAEVKWIGSLD